LGRIFLLAFGTLAALSGSRAEATPPDARPVVARTEAATSVPRLVFFMNPNGMPCQTQDRILQEMSAELKGKVQVVYVRTTDRNDFAKFEQYGIRSLPSLVLTDASGREIRRATPGIQSAAQVRRLLEQ
jgi:thioredoxin 1